MRTARLAPVACAIGLPVLFLAHAADPVPPDVPERLRAAALQQDRD